MRGSPTVFSAKMSSGCSGRRDCAETVWLLAPRTIAGKPDTTEDTEDSAGSVRLEPDPTTDTSTSPISIRLVMICSSGFGVVVHLDCCGLLARGPPHGRLP